MPRPTLEKPPRPKGQFQPGHSGNPNGRPTEYRADYPHMALCHCLLGATNARLADLFKVSEETIDHWIENRPEFKEAVLEGRVNANANVFHSLYKRGCGFTVETEQLFYDRTSGEVVRAKTYTYYPPETNAASKFLANRLQDGWKGDIVRQEVSGPNGTPLQPPIINILPVRSPQSEPDQTAP